MRNHTTLPFVEGRMYTATRNQSDRNFEIGKKYKCVKIDKPQHFHMNLQKDGSTLKFVNPEGIEMGYFGSVATGYFTDNTNEISEALNQYMKYANESVSRSRGEMEAKLSIVINHIETIKQASIDRNEIIKRAKEHGLTINSSITDIDGFAIDSQINALKAVTANLEKAISQKPTNYEKFKSTYSYKQLMKNHSLSEHGIWEILGEDPNCDMGGSHHQPSLEIVEGTLEKAIQYGVELPGFWQWGGGGSIIKRETKIKRL
jgi:hypothetical protein